MPELPETDWKRYFDAHAPRYMENVFTKNTVAEIDFFLSLFPLARVASILDVGCGTGRHSVELAKRGFSVTGLDISEGMLREARKAADAAAVQVNWVQGDATEIRFSKEFDAAICLCEGAFGLINSGDDPEEHDRVILHNAAHGLKSNAPFLLTALNGYSVIRRMSDEMVQQGLFDPATMVADYYDEWTVPEGTIPIRIRERLFIPPEIGRMLGDAGFTVDHVYGGTAGSWGRRPVSLDEIEVMFVCRKG